MKLNFNRYNDSDAPSAQSRNLLAKAKDFHGRYPIFCNILLIVLAGIVVVWVLLFVVDSVTLHGREQTVPDVKGQYFSVAKAALEHEGLTVAIADSIFDTAQQPGTVVDQNPRSGSKVKPGRDIYLTIVAYSPKLVTFPDVVNTSLRQGYSMIEGVGIKQIVVKRVPSEYENLVLGAFVDGREIKPGRKIPVNSIVTIEVGEGFGEALPEDYTDDFEAEGDV